MIKKICLCLLFLFVILFVWVSFADVIEPWYHRVEHCVLIKNTIIWKYKVVIDYPSIYNPKPNECLAWDYKKRDSNIYLLPFRLPSSSVLSWKWIKVWNLYAWRINVKDWDDRDFILEEYEIVKIDWEYKLVLQNEWNINKYVRNFLLALVVTIIIETLVLFIIAKNCWNSWTFKNRKLCVVWILASSVTLPLLRFVLPIFFKFYLVYVVFWEIFVMIIETFIIKYSLKVERKMAIFASIVCNLCSFLVWLFIF